jgi:2-hydroxychromene-2-carboxylate isomerase
LLHGGQILARTRRPRCARYYDLRFNPPQDVQLSPLAAARAVTWAHGEAPGRCEALTLALYRRYWAEGVDISTPDAVADVAAKLGFARTETLHALADPRVKDSLARSVEQAIAKGIFGSPFFVVDGEPFWGADRLPMLRDWLVRGRW